MLNRKIYALSMSLGLLPLLANTESSCPLIPGNRIEVNQVSPGYYYPARFDLKSCQDFIVTADFIYWAVSKQLNSIGLEQNVVGTATSKTDVLAHSFGYRPGFKVGVGMGLPGFDDFVINAEYTWFNHSTTTSRTASPGHFITPIPGITAPPPAPQPLSSHVKSKWRFGLNTAELTAGRPFYMGKRLILNPFFGLKAFWFNERQSIDFDLIGGGQATEKCRFKSWALGPYLTMNAKALLWGGVYLLGKTGALFPYQRYTENSFKANFATTLPFQQDFNWGKKKPYTFQPYLETGMGLGWGRYFNQRATHLDLAITYDYFGAWFLNTVTFGGPISKDHYMHGLTARAQLDF